MDWHMEVMDRHFDEMERQMDWHIAAMSRRAAISEARMDGLHWQPRAIAGPPGYSGPPVTGLPNASAPTVSLPVVEPPIVLADRHRERRFWVMIVVGFSGVLVAVFMAVWVVVLGR